MEVQCDFFVASFGSINAVDMVSDALCSFRKTQAHFDLLFTMT